MIGNLTKQLDTLEKETLAKIDLLGQMIEHIRDAKQCLEIIDSPEELTSFLSDVGDLILTTELPQKKARKWEAVYRNLPDAIGESVALSLDSLPKCTDVRNNVRCILSQDKSANAFRWSIKIDGDKLVITKTGIWECHQTFQRIS